MEFTLGPAAVAAGYRLAAFETIGSTSTEAAERARAGDPGLLWIVSRAQTAGHGRRGRRWETPAGNLAASLLLPLSGSRADAAKLGFVAGLALDDAIAACAPAVSVRVALDAADGGARLRLKWPNDVLIDGAKIAGILLEAVAGADGVPQVVIGFGVNVAQAPEGLPYPATSLVACGAALTVEDLFGQLGESWTKLHAAWDEGRGFADIRRRWLERAAGLGAEVAVSTGQAVIRGTFETLDDEGMLVLRESGGLVRRIAAGDVHFGAVTTAGR